jgi:hypothetical protein
MKAMDCLLGAARRAGIWASTLLVLGLVACGGPQEPAGEGESCYRDADCEHGLACVANAARERKCSRDVSSLVDQVEGPPPPPDAGTPEEDAGEEPPADGG